MEEAGQCRRGYFVEGLGAAQFALPGAVDRMRAMAAAQASVTGPAVPEAAYGPPSAPGISAMPTGTPAISAVPVSGPGVRQDAPVQAGTADGAPGAPVGQPTWPEATHAAPGVQQGAPGWPGAPDAIPRTPQGAPCWPGAPDAIPGTPQGAPGWPGPPPADAYGKPEAEAPQVTVLAAADPANAFGAALAWPPRPGEVPGAHRPGRKAGALVVLSGGDLVLYVERGGKTLLSWTSDPAVLVPAAAGLAAAVRGGALGRLTVERADGTGVYDTPLAQALADAGFRPTPRGLRLRG